MTTPGPCPLCGSKFPKMGGREKVKCTNLACYLSKEFIWIPVDQWNAPHGSTMNIQAAARETQLYVGGAVFMTDDLPATSPEHIEQLLLRIEYREYKNIRQADRWLGWSQCAIYQGRGLSLGELKLINKKA